MEVFEWQPHLGIQHDLNIQGFRYEGQALVIVFGDFENNGIFRMTFPSPLAFRCTDELHLNVCYNPRDFKGSQFYIVKDSAGLGLFGLVPPILGVCDLEGKRGSLCHFYVG